MGYNGDIVTIKDYENLVKEYSEINSVMLGRGLLRNPALIEQICTGGKAVDMNKMGAFHNRIYEDYRSVMSGDTPTLYKMKELWSYMIHFNFV